MAYDSTKPAIADNYSTGYTQTIRDNFDFVLKLGEASGSNLSVTGTPPTGAKRYNPTSDIFEQYSGGWTELPLNYLKKVGGSSQTVDGTVNFSGTLQAGGSAVWTQSSLVIANYMPKSGGAFTDAVTGTTFEGSGRLFGNGASSNNGIGKVTVTSTTSPPSGGSQGDIHVIY
jgi:hypothetical protein